MTSVTFTGAVTPVRGHPPDPLRDGPASAGATAPQVPTEPATPRAIAPPSAPSESTATKSGERYTQEEKQEISRLKTRDAEVRRHEQAHKAAGGQYAGAITYNYRAGPDGKRYAVGGEVPIDTSVADTPEATIQKMEIVIRAALAPLEPSPEDRAIAQLAQRQKVEAQGDLRAERREEQAERLEATRTRPEQNAVRAYKEQADAVEDAHPSQTDKSV